MLMPQHYAGYDAYLYRDEVETRHVRHTMTPSSDAKYTDVWWQIILVDTRILYEGTKHPWRTLRESQFSSKNTFYNTF